MFGRRSAFYLQKTFWTIALGVRKTSILEYQLVSFNNILKSRFTWKMSCITFLLFYETIIYIVRFSNEFWEKKRFSSINSIFMQQISREWSDLCKKNLACSKVFQKWGLFQNWVFLNQGFMYSQYLAVGCRLVGPLDVAVKDQNQIFSRQTW